MYVSKQSITVALFAAIFIGCIDLWLWRRIIEGNRTPFRKKRQRKEQAIKIFCKTSLICAFHVGRSSRALRRLLERGEESPLIALHGASAPQ
jgi:hypothetical protein